MLAAGVDRRGWRSAKTTGTTGAPIEFVLDEARRLRSRPRSDAISTRGSARPAWRALISSCCAPLGRGLAALPSPFASAGASSKWNLLNAWQLPDSRFADVLAQLMAV